MNYEDIDKALERELKREKQYIVTTPSVMIEGKKIPGYELGVLAQNPEQANYFAARSIIEGEFPNSPHTQHYIFHLSSENIKRSSRNTLSKVVRLSDDEMGVSAE